MGGFGGCPSGKCPPGYCPATYPYWYILHS
jgi:hypothetical protein